MIVALNLSLNKIYSCVDTLLSVFCQLYLNRSKVFFSDTLLLCCIRNVIHRDQETTKILCNSYYLVPLHFIMFSYKVLLLKRKENLTFLNDLVRVYFLIWHAAILTRDVVFTDIIFFLLVISVICQCLFLIDCLRFLLRA